MTWNLLNSIKDPEEGNIRNTYLQHTCHLKAVKHALGERVLQIHGLSQGPYKASSFAARGSWVQDEIREGSWFWRGGSVWGVFELRLQEASHQHFLKKHFSLKISFFSEKSKYYAKKKKNENWDISAYLPLFSWDFTYRITKAVFPSSHRTAMELGLNCRAGMLSLSPLSFVPAR